jgi:uncharacterized protein (DUF983 family)
MASALSCKCPACGKAPLFTGVLRVFERCPHCGLDLAGQDAGDGPAFFAILIIGFLVTFGAAAVELAYAPPFWVHALLWGPGTLIACLLVLRLSKSYLIHAEYRLKERNGIR